MMMRTRGLSLPAAGVGILLGVATAATPDQAAGPAPVLRTDTITRVARTRTPAVVFLHTVREGAPEPARLDPILAPPQQMRRPARTMEEGLGSGVIIDSSGLILTNAHVIEGADAIHYRTADGDDGDVTVVGTDRDSDVALLRAQTTSPLRPAPLGNSARVNVGDWVVAIGSPLGLHHTVTSGIISAKARGLDDSGIEFLQTDAAINPGNSGGALFDLKGALVGITTAIISAGGENIGLNFAIPIDTVKEILPKLRTGDVVHGWIGIRMIDVNRSAARALGIDSGLLVVALAANGPAARAGIRIGDVIVVETSPGLATSQDLYRHIRDAMPGTTMALTAWRAKQRVGLQVEVGTRPREK